MRIKFNVTGMTCAACSARVEKVTNAVDGVQKAEVNLLGGTMMVDAASDSVVAPIIKAITDSGYGAALAGEKARKEPEKPKGNPEKEMKRRIIWSSIFLGILMYFTMGHMVGLPAPHWYHGSENALVAALLQFFLTLPAVYLNRSYYIRIARKTDDQMILVFISFMGFSPGFSGSFFLVSTGMAAPYPLF